MLEGLHRKVQPFSLSHYCAVTMKGALTPTSS